MITAIDAHHHIWRRDDLPWLSGPMEPRIFGPYGAIRRDYPMEEYFEDIARSEVTRSVYVQANWPPDRFEDEVAWVQGVADDCGWPQAIVGYADVTVADVRPQLDRLAQYSRVRGVRMQLHWHRDPSYCFAATPDLARDPTVQRNIAHLGDYGFGFELQVFAPQMAGAAELVAACPGVTFVLQHAGMLEDTSPAGLATWRAGMATLAAAPNLVVKLSGLGTFLRRNDPQHIATVAGEVVEMFGAERCLFGSNFPIEKLWTDYETLVSAYRRALSTLDEQVARAVLWDTAARVYRIA
ncbi:MAG: amidohydrolase family protein [Candidatus Competibacterales bacterium]